MGDVQAEAAMLETGGTYVPTRRRALAVTPEMLHAGREAFTRHRRRLDDLYHCFDCDRDAFLRAIYRSMRAAEGT